MSIREEGDVSKWQAMRERKTLHDFPCPREGWADGEFRQRCYPELEKCGQDGECSYELVYHQYVALHAVVAAVLDGATPVQRAQGARRLAAHAKTTGLASEDSYIATAEAWEGMA